MSTDISTIAVRQVPPEGADYDALADLVNEAYTIYPFMHGPRTDPPMLREEAGGSGQFLLAETDAGELVGCSLIKPSLDVDWSYAAGMKPVGAEKLYFGVAAIRPAAMRSGIGRLLLRRAEELARERGYSEMVLTTIEEMGLVEYYAAEGYSTLDTRLFGPDHWAIDIPHTLHTMGKRL